MTPETLAYLESQQAAFGGDFETEYALEPDPVPTGIGPLDDALGGGLSCGVYTIVGGMAGVGKSAIAVATLYGMASRGMFPVYITCEMPSQQVRMRMASIHASCTEGLEAFPWSRARDSFRGRFSDAQLEKLRTSDDDTRSRWAEAYIRKFGGSDPAIMAWRSMSESGIAQRAMVREDITSLDGVCSLISERAWHGIHDAVIVDYAQILDVQGAKEEYERMTAVSRALQQSAREAHCPIMLISSLRNVQKGEKEPGLTWFRGSGYLGYDAGAAVILKKGGWQTVEHLSIEAHILKNRNGRVPDGPVPIIACPKFGTFE